jgi:predicted nucleic acid-binding protein
MPGSFFDSNVLLYIAGPPSPKADAASSVLRGRGMISVQVLNEVASVARGKMKLSWPETREMLAAFREGLRVWPLTITTHDLGLRLAERYHFHIYDAMIVAAALEADCDVLYSEDMQNGLRIDDRLTITNPFAT